MLDEVDMYLQSIVENKTIMFSILLLCLLLTKQLFIVWASLWMALKMIYIHLHWKQYLKKSVSNSSFPLSGTVRYSTVRYGTQ